MTPNDQDEDGLDQPDADWLGDLNPDETWMNEDE